MSMYAKILKVEGLSVSGAEDPDVPPSPDLVILFKVRRAMMPPETERSIG